MFSSAVLFSPFPIFWVFRAMRVPSFPLLLHSLRTLLGALVGILPGLFRCILSFLAYFSCSSCCFFSRPSFTSFFLILSLEYFSEGAPGFFAFSPLRRLPLLLLLGVLRLLLLLLPLLSFMLLACGVSRFVGFWWDSFLSSFIMAAFCSSSLVFPSFSPRSFWFSSSDVFVSGLLCLLAPWFPMFFVFSFSVVSSFRSLHPSSLFLLRFRFPSFSAGSEGLWRGGGFSLFVASPLRR